MTALTLAIRHALSQDPVLTELLGRSTTWPTWIFSEKVGNVNFESWGRSMIVINETGQTSAPNPHNHMTFPKVTVDIWSDPTRNDDGSTRFDDAKSKINTINQAVNRTLHTVSLQAPGGRPIVWGTPEQVAAGEAFLIGGSSQLSGPDFSPIKDTENSWMGRCTYGLNVY